MQGEGDVLTDIKSISDFVAHKWLTEDEVNGLNLNNVYLPEDVIINILSFIDPKEILKLSLVCKKWCRLTRSLQLWRCIYERISNKKAKRLPWFLYYVYFTKNFFDVNLLKNGNGEEGFNHWNIVQDPGNQMKVESEPTGSDLLPENVPDFNGHKSCFVTSFYNGIKYQEIEFHKSRLYQTILDYYKPHVYISEWIAARFDCGAKYNLEIILLGEKVKKKKKQRKRPLLHFFTDNSLEESEQSGTRKVLKVFRESHSIDQWQGREWIKKEILINDIPEGIHILHFQHEAQDTQFWAGHYGMKMAGGVVKILFDSIQEKANDIFLNYSDILDD